MQPDSYAEGRRWYLQACEDAKDALLAFDNNRHSLTCFLAQQTGEKALKAYLYASGATMVLGHSVAELVKKAAEGEKKFDLLISRVSPLDKYYIPTRYPNGLPGGIPAEAFDREDAKHALQMAELILREVHQTAFKKEAGPPKLIS